MVIDTSAIVAVLFAEPDKRRFQTAMEAAEIRLVSAVTRVEAAFVVEGRKGEAGRRLLKRFFRLIEAEIAAVTSAQATIAIDAFRRFGKGRHRAAFNIGDCFPDALSVATGLPLLFKGDHFTHIDVRSASIAALSRSCGAAKRAGPCPAFPGARMAT